MAVTGNILSEIGDVILFNTGDFVLGITGFDGIENEDYTGETENRYFIKTFRYTTNGITYSSWMPLTSENLESIVYDASSPFRIEYSFQRGGSDASGNLVFNYIEIHFNYQVVGCSDLYNDSIFAEFSTCTDPDRLAWCLNVLDKMVNYGIVPKYVERNAGNDVDYIALFKAISCFFAMIVIYGRKLMNIRVSNRLVGILLSERGMITDINSDTDMLMNVLENLYSEMSRRGTEGVFSTGYGEYGRVGNTRPHVHMQLGELLRTIFYSPDDEYMYTLIRPERMGITIDKSFPLYRGTSEDDMVIKGYSEEKDFTELTLASYPLIRSNDITIASVASPIGEAETNVSVAVLNKASTWMVGIYPETYGSSKSFVIDNKIDYEITFWALAEGTSALTFGCKAYNGAGAAVAFSSPVSVFLSDNNFLEKEHIVPASRWVFVRGIIYGSNTEDITAEFNVTNIGLGKALRFSANAVRIAPYVVNDDLGGGDRVPASSIKIWDFKVRPLLYPFGFGVIQSQNLTHVWCKNNNPGMGTEVIDTTTYHKIHGHYMVTSHMLEKFVREYLIPYNSDLIINVLNE